MFVTDWTHGLNRSKWPTSKTKLLSLAISNSFFADSISSVTSDDNSDDGAPPPKKSKSPS